VTFSSPEFRTFKLVAVVFLIDGFAAMAGMAVRLAQGSLVFDFGVLGIPTYFGLMRGSKGWRTWALVTLWLGMLMAPMVAIAGAVARSPAYFAVFGIPIRGPSPGTVCAIAALSFSLQLWQYRTLTRQHVREAFRVGEYGRRPDPGLQQTG
jgi:hypothetical protein